MNENQLLIENKRLRMIIEDLKKQIEDYEERHQKLLNQNSSISLRFLQ